MAEELKEEVERASEEIGRAYADKQEKGRNYLFDMATKEGKEALEQIKE